MTKRTRLIIGAIALLFLFPYLGGLLAQCAHAAFASPSEPVPAILLSPFVCYRYACTLSGLQYTLLTIAIVCGAGFWLGKRFGGDVDARNFTRSKKGTYGTAGWMNASERQAFLENVPPEQPKGTILGTDGRSLVVLPDDTPFNKHIGVFGASGTRKSRGFVRPYLLQCIRRGESVVCTDPKGEHYRDLAQSFRRNGYTVKVLNLVDPTHSDAWNCMEQLNGDTLRAQILTDIIIANTGNGHGDPFWDNGEQNLLRALILYVDQAPGYTQKTLPAAYKLLTHTPLPHLTAMFERLPITHPAKAPYNLFAQASDSVKSGIVIGLGTRLQTLQSKEVERLISTSDISLTLPGKEKCAYFIILSDQGPHLQFLSSLFFSLLFQDLVIFADRQPSGRCPIPVHIVLEELNNIGDNPIPRLPSRLSVLRARAIHVCCIVQSLGQLQSRFPDHQWAEILGNLDIQMLFGCTDLPTAEYFSQRSGEMTVEVQSQMTTRQSIALTQVVPQYRLSESVGHRALLTPDEILRLPNDELLLALRGCNLLCLKKYDYSQHPDSKYLVSSDIETYPSPPEIRQDVSAVTPPSPRKPVTHLYQPAQQNDFLRR